MLVDESTLSQKSIQNLNILIKTTRQMLDDLDSDLFSVDEIAYFILMSIGFFNGTPGFSNITPEDTDVLEKYHNVFRDGAVLMAMSVLDMSPMSTNDIKTITLSQMLGTRWAPEWSNYFDKIKLIKNSWSIEPPKSLVTLATTVCTKCKQDYPYASPSVGFTCWGCRNGY